jgi:hypothetical protein
MTASSIFFFDNEGLISSRGDRIEGPIGSVLISSMQDVSEVS